MRLHSDNESDSYGSDGDYQARADGSHAMRFIGSFGLLCVAGSMTGGNCLAIHYKRVINNNEKPKAEQRIPKRFRAGKIV
jgi:hypothetical protein